MTPPRAAFFPVLLFAIFICKRSVAQLPPRPLPLGRDLFGLRRYHPAQPPLAWKPVPIARWIVSVNPLGVLESPVAISAGIGYRLNNKVELWIETALLRNGLLYSTGPTTGFRQILQWKRFLNNIPNVFLAVELRYKSFSFDDSNYFYNPSTHDTLKNAGFLSSHYSYGAGVQIGSRYCLSKDGKLQMEWSIGFGIKNKRIDRKGIPPGYDYLPRRFSTDLSIADLLDTPGATPYLPGSLRIIYCLGKTRPSY
jgi:hypothetical protein